MPFLLVVACLWLVGPGCSCDPEAEGLGVSLQTDFVPGVEFDRVRATVDAARAFDLDTGADDSFARPRRLTTYQGLRLGRRDVEVSLWQGERQLASRRVSIEFTGSQIVNVVIARTCEGVTCDSGETCVGGACVSPRCVTGTEPECPRPQCTTPSQCAASAACVAPSCVAGVCLETSGDDCAASEVCVPAIGCVAVATERDAGAHDASADAPQADAPGLDAPTLDAGSCDETNCVAGPCETATCVAGICQRASTCAMGESCCSGVCALDCASADCAGRPAGEVCRPAAGACDVEERCDGGAMCPPDAFASAATECRAAAGECDVAERCSGVAPECPMDAYQPDGTVCAAGSCDGLGTCSSACVPGSACATGNPCERGRRVCPSGACVSAGAAPAGIVCRDSAGVCDPEETCDGTSTACPSDRRVAAGTECRTARGVCDRAESCDGASAACPSDVREPPSTVCRAAAAGGCDVAETCTGSADACPANVFASASTTCRAAVAGGCDVAERCTGASAVCPSDVVASSATVCRAALGSCDAPETCDGATTTCPPEPGRRYGDACCAGAACSGGSVCLGTRCAVFGGTYAIDQSGNAVVPCIGNPLVAGATCTCPSGFVAQQLEDADWSVDEGLGWNNRLYVCVAPGAPSTGTDFTGAHGRTTTGNPFSSGCANACTFPATTTGGCSCPAGSTAALLTSVHYLNGSSLDCEREITYCEGSAAPLTYGGAFWRYTDGSDGVCDASLPAVQRCVANPETGLCACPAGFVEQVTPLMQRRVIDRGFGPEQWYCRGQSVVCGRIP
jgi:hypothetical protein